MTSLTIEAPFGREPVPEIHLDEAPLRRVICQVRFPSLVALATGVDVAHRIAGALQNEYPLLEEGQEVTITISPSGVTQAPANSRVWQLRSPDAEWTVTYGAQFVALNTESYTDRDDFRARLRRVLDCFAAEVSPPFVERIGWRYVNRVEVPPADLRDLIRAELLGGVAARLDNVALVNAMNEALYDFTSGAADDNGISKLVGQVADGLQVRWGMLPPGAALDPTLPPWPNAGWVLDLDSFLFGRSTFDVDVLMEKATGLSDRAYRFFRWSVTDQFLQRFGAVTDDK